MELNALQTIIIKLEAMLDQEEISSNNYNLIVQQLKLFSQYAQEYSKNPQLQWHEFINQQK